MITTTDTSALLTFVNSNRQGRLLPVAAFATILARVSWINSFKHTPGAFSLGLCHPEKVPPGHIADRLREMAVFQHPRMFKSSTVIATNRLTRLADTLW